MLSQQQSWGSMSCHRCSPADGHRAKYQLKHVVRSHLGANDTVFNAIRRAAVQLAPPGCCPAAVHLLMRCSGVCRQLEDDQGIKGIKLSKNVLSAAACAPLTG